MQNKASSQYHANKQPVNSEIWTLKQSVTKIINKVNKYIHRDHLPKNKIVNFFSTCMTFYFYFAKLKRCFPQWKYHHVVLKLKTQGLERREGE